MDEGIFLSFCRFRFALLAVLHRRDAELCAEALHKIRAIGKSAMKACVLNAVAHAQKLFGLRKAAGFYVQRGSCLEIGRKIAIKRAV